MYAVGSKVVHPCHGAGTIVRISEKQIGDISHTYYIIDTVSLARSMRVMVPVKRADSVGLRAVQKASTLRELLQTCSEPPADDEIERDFRVRKDALGERLKSGCLEDVIYAVRSLHYMTTQRRLGLTDSRMLEDGKQMLASELAVASGISMEDAMLEVQAYLGQMTSEEESN
jgi:CarD family transcriptional regulator